MQRRGAWRWTDGMSARPSVRAARAPGPRRDRGSSRGARREARPLAARARGPTIAREPLLSRRTYAHARPRRAATRGSGKSSAMMGTPRRAANRTPRKGSTLLSLSFRTGMRPVFLDCRLRAGRRAGRSYLTAGLPKAHAASGSRTSGTSPRAMRSSNCFSCSRKASTCSLGIGGVWLTASSSSSMLERSS